MTSHPLAERYDSIWNAAASEVRAGRASLDDWALRKHEDARRGVTLLARPAPSVAHRLVELVDELRAIEPAQYYHPRADLHFTMLSLFTATADYAPHLAHVDDYRAAVEEAIDGVPPFAIDVRGVTLSTAAVLPGLPARRHAGAPARPAAHGAGGARARRHARPALPAAHGARHARALRAAAARPRGVRRRARRGAQAPFGTSRVAPLELVLGDWFTSKAHERALAACALQPSANGATSSP